MPKIFFSYSHNDEELRNELDKHLSILKRQGIIESWHDRRINAGTDIDAEISKHLKEADIILLLVSSDFLASNYCYDKEMLYAMEQHGKGKAIAVPVILRPCDWHDAPFGKLLAVPTDGKPITKFSNYDDAFLEITTAIKKLANNSSRQVNSDSIFNRKIDRILPRSSNLRVERKFTDKETDEFLDNGFEYIANFFEGSLEELENRNAHIQTKFKRIDSENFTAHIYSNGEKKTECLISYSSNRGYSKGITYSYSASSFGNSFNESLSVQDDGYMLSLKPIGMNFRQNLQEKLTYEGAAEYFWEMLIEPLQRQH